MPISLLAVSGFPEKGMKRQINRTSFSSPSRCSILFYFLGYLINTSNQTQRLSHQMREKDALLYEAFLLQSPFRRNSRPTPHATKSWYVLAAQADLLFKTVFWSQTYAHS